MNKIVRLPTKFGQGHSDAIAFFQDEIMPLLIENKIACLSVIGIAEDGTEINCTMLALDNDDSNARNNNIRLLGLTTEMQARFCAYLLSGE